MGAVDDAVAAIKAGKPVILPTDTVYGLVADPYRAAPAERIYKLKGRDAGQPFALLATDVEYPFECVPQLRGRSGRIARALLPGPYTLVFPNPARRFRWLTGTSPDTIGVRVAELPGEAGEVLRRAGCVVATSANRSGEPDARRVEDVPEELRERCGAVVDAGELPGVPSTVVDCTGAEPRVLREGAAPAADTLARIAAA